MEEGKKKTTRLGMIQDNSASFLPCVCKEKERVLRLDSKENQQQLDPLLREFVEEVSLWVKISLPVLVQVGHFLDQIIHETKDQSGLDKTLLVNVGPFRLALVYNSYILGFTYQLEQISYFCPQGQHGFRMVDCKLVDILPSSGITRIIELLTAVQHPIRVPLDKWSSSCFLDYHHQDDSKVSKEMQEKEDIRKTILQASVRVCNFNDRYWRIIYTIESHMLSLVNNWWCGSVQSLAEIGYYGYSLLSLLSEIVSKKEPMPRFLKEKEIPSLLTGIVYLDSDEREYILGIDMHGKMVDEERNKMDS